MGRLNMVSKFNWMSLAALLLGALTVMFGVQLLRTLFVGMAVYLTQVQEISPILVGVLGLAVFLCGFLTPVVRRALGLQFALPVVIGLLTLVWLAREIRLIAARRPRPVDRRDGPIPLVPSAHVSVDPNNR